MDNLAVILFICIVVPLALLLFLLDKKSRLVVFFMIIGCFICLFVSSVNSILLVLSGKDLLYVVTTITPISEEILKAFPILLFAFSISDDRRTLISISMAVGIGFAIMENTMIKCREHHCIVGSCPRIRIEPNAWPVHINGRMWYFCRKTKEKAVLYRDICAAECGNHLPCNI